MIAAASVFVALILALPRISAAWIGLLGAVALELPHGMAVAVSPGASVVLPVVCGALVAVELPLVRRFFWLGVVLVVSFGVDLALVVVWATAGLPAAWMSAPENVAQFLLPIAVLALAMSEAMAVARATRGSRPCVSREGRVGRPRRRR